MQGAAAIQLAEFAENVLLGGQEFAIRRRIFEAIDSGDPPDPVKAAQAWIELRAVYKLIHRLEKTATSGKSAGKALSDLTTEDQ